MSTFIEKINEALGLAQAQLDEAKKPKKKMVGPPAAWGALYVGPNPDGSKKRCENCFMWTKDNKCLIFEKSETVNKTMVCGYHVYGTPREKWIDMGIHPIPTKLAGLVEIGEGSCCHDCKYYFKPDKCAAVATEDGGSVPADVEDLGCCSRFSPK